MFCLHRTNQCRKVDGKIAGYLVSRNKNTAWKEFEPFIYTHANATHHKSEFAKIYLSGLKCSALPCPAQSPDFKILVNVVLHKKIQMNPDARAPSRCKQQFIERVFEEWRKVPVFFPKIFTLPFQIDIRPLLLQEAIQQNGNLL